MEIADAATPLGQKLVGADKLPVAVLATPGGDTVAKIENQDGFLRAEKVEKIVDEEMKHRDNSLEQQLKQAKEHAKSGDSTGAIPLYRAVLDQKCLFPKRAKDAAKELKKLGVNDVGDILNSPDYRFPCLRCSKKRQDRTHHAARIDGGECLQICRSRKAVRQGAQHGPGRSGAAAVPG